MVDHSTYAAVASAVEEKNRAGADLNELIEFMRASGLSIVESMKVLVEVNGYSLPAAKNVLHHSEAWADLREQREAFQEDMIRGLERDSGTQT